jgi:translation initiation factor 1
MSKKINSFGGLVYSTNPNMLLHSHENIIETLPNAQQPLRIGFETKHRAGKTVTLITGFVGTNEDLNILGKQLKNHCGTGGSAKDNEIIVQGNHVDKVIQWLQKQGYTLAKKR